jgi:predicted nucleic acid-binding protein
VSASGDPDVIPIVFDASPLNCFATGQKLHVLRALVADRSPHSTNAVMDELQAGPAAEADFSWVSVQAVDHLDELRAFMRYAEIMGSGRRHLGEATVLAWAEVHGGIAIIDDQAAKKAAKRQGVRCHGSLWLILEGFKAGILREAEACQLVDVLRDTNARFPVDGATLIEWARKEGLLT